MKVVKIIKDVAFFLYQWLVFVPIFIVLTILTALIVMIFSPIFGNKFWGYYPPKWWSKLTCWLALLYITGGSNSDEMPNWKKKDNDEIKMIGAIAEKNKAVTAMLSQVPNQPLYNGLKEDSPINKNKSLFIFLP